jgi:hypothetical protein
MTMSSFGEDKMRIFHPLTFGAVCYASCVPYPIEKITLRGFSLSIRMDFAKKTDDHIVYFLNLTIFDKIQLKP